MKIDILIVGGGFAGLSAALYTARGMRKGVLCTAGQSRNAVAPHTHGFLTQDGSNPAQVLQTARNQLAPYDFPIIDAEVTQITGTNGAFTAQLFDGQTIQSRKVILTTGVQDILPNIPGFQEAWGRTVHHCSYCYGWEVRGQQIATYQTNLSGVEGLQTILYFQKLTRDVLVCSDGSLDFTMRERQLLQDRGITLIDSPLHHIEEQAEGINLHFLDGTSAHRAVLYAHGERRLRAGLAEALGCTLTEAGIKIDPVKQLTSVPGVYAAGDVSGSNQVVFATASGARAAMQATNTLFYEDLPPLT